MSVASQASAQRFYCGATSVVGAGNGDAVGAGSGAREHTDWHEICCVEQFSWQAVLTFALLVNVAAPIDGVPGTTQVVWHAAACELHNIMQPVTAEVCASALPPRAFTAQPTAKSRMIVDNRRMTASRRFRDA
ncbi:MAG TPA: hypothetical protein VGH13_18065 [Xanthobacteraceae bacterium]